MYTLYGYPGTGSAAVECALELAAVPFRIVQAASWDPESALAELTRLNPQAQIPTLVLPDGGVLTESAAILIHLGLEHPRSGLLPTAPALRAQALRGLVWIAANAYAAIGVIDYPERWLARPGKAALQNLRGGARMRLHHHWEVFADHHAAPPFFGDGPPGALELLAAVVSKWSGARPHLAKERPALAAALAAVDRHERVAPVFARHWDR